MKRFTQLFHPKTYNIFFFLNHNTRRLHFLGMLYSIISFSQKKANPFSSLNIQLKLWLGSIAIILFWSCQPDIKPPNTLVEYIPQDAQIVFKINDLTKAKSVLRDNEFLKKNDSIRLIQYFKDLEVINQSKEEEAVLCFSPVGKNSYEFTYISKFDPAILSSDSLQTKNIENLTYDKKSFYKITSNDHTFFAAQQDSILVASSSQLLIENAIRLEKNKVVIADDLRKAFEVSDSKSAVSILLDGQKLGNIHNRLLPKKVLSSLKNFSSWISADASVSQNAIYINGVAIARDSLSSTIDIFDNTIPQENKLALITPATAQGFISFTYDDFGILKKNLAFAQDREISTIPDVLDNILGQSSEFGLLYLENETLLALTAIDAKLVDEKLGGSSVEAYRDVTILSYDRPEVFAQTLRPLIPDFEANFYIKHKDHFIFSPTKNGLQTIIANLLNKSVWSSEGHYKSCLDKLSSTSSILVAGKTKTVKSYLADHSEENEQSNFKNLQIGGYESGMLQIVKEDHFAHLHGVFQKNTLAHNTAPISQSSSTTLENDLYTHPILVKNHRSKGLDVAIQDMANQLYLISDKGVIFWKKQIDGPIMGDIKQIDIYKNGRYQLLFNTQNTLYLVDRNGEDVRGYPIAFDEPMTLPLALFDYDKNKKYRILLTQGNKTTMLDGKGKVVTGFRFKETETNQIISPTHIRIGRKDHLVFAQENGKLTILDRLGKNRITVKENIDFSKNPWYLYQGKFTSIDKNGALVQVDTKGAVSRNTFASSTNNQLVATSKSLVTLAENKLTIKGQTIELEFGVYTAPKLFYIKDKIYITVTDTQAKKVYMFDSNAKLFPNFPVYGTSAVSLGNMDKDPKLEFTVKGENNSVLIYEMK